MPPRARIISRPIARVAIPQLATWRTLRTNTNQLFCRLRSEEHTSELQSQSNLVCRLLLEKKKTETVALVRDLRLVIHSNNRHDPPIVIARPTPDYHDQAHRQILALIPHRRTVTPRGSPT